MSNHTPRTPAQTGSAPHAQHPGLAPSDPARSHIDGIWTALLVVLYAAMGALLLVMYAEPCEPGHLCAMAALPGTWAQRLRTWWQAGRPKPLPTPLQPEPAPQPGPHGHVHTLASLAQSPYISNALQAAWHDGFSAAEPGAYRQGWRSGLFAGVCIALYLGVPLVYAGVLLGRWMLLSLGWL